VGLILANTDFSWLLPDMTFGGWALRLVFVYPLIYLLGYRMLVRPVWDVLCSFYYLVAWTTKMWDKSGFVPDSVMREEEAIVGGPGPLIESGLRWTFRFLH
jgi:hypothetical protein